MPERLENVFEDGNANQGERRHRFVRLQQSWLGKRKLKDTDLVEKSGLSRKAAFKWLKGTEHILRLYGHDGWEAFKPLPVVRAGHWPYIAVSLDQGSDGYAAMHFLIHKLGVNADLVPDPSHQWHRDVQNTWSALGWGSWTRLLVVPINLFHGPFAAGARYHEYRESSVELVELLRLGENTFVEEFADELKRELKLGGGPLEDGQSGLIVEAIATRLHEQRRGSKVAMCRFASLLDSLEHLCENWSIYLLQTLHVMGDEKFKLKDLQSTFAKSKQATSDPDARDSTTAEVKRMRDLCSSNVAVTCALLSDWEGRTRSQVIRVFSSATREWYGSQSTKLRSQCDAREWFVLQCGRGLLQPLLQTFRLLRDIDALGQCGIGVSVVGSLPEVDDPRLEHERVVAKCIGEYTCCLVKERIKRVAWLSHGDLSLVAKIAGPSPEERAKSAKKCRERMLAVQEAAKGSQWWQSVASR
eukprot:6460296-Amphidinium_carterae.2